jgi:trans-aconitate methyltransferase
MATTYQFPALYGLLMRLAYGRDYPARYELVAERIDRPDDILEVCCGHLGLYKHLARRGLVRSYVGLDRSPAVLRHARRRGVNVRAFDVRAGHTLPIVDTVVMQASLYQFHDIAETLLARLWGAARRRLIVAEPVRNLAQSRHAAVRWTARTLTRTHDGVHTFRYTEALLLELYRRCQVPVSGFERTPGGREVVVCSLRLPSA